MRTLLPIVLIAIPLIEIALFVLVGDLIGLWPTLAATVLAALVGVSLIRGRSLAALRHMQPGQPAQALPIASVVNGMAIVAAGLLLIVPGFLTDLLGLSLLAPPVRRLLGRGLFRRFNTGHAAPGGAWPGGAWPGGEGIVIDGDAVVVREPSPRKSPDSTVIQLPPGRPPPATPPRREEP